MKLERTTEPAGLPISQTLAEDFLNLSPGEDSALVLNAMGAATDELENDLDMALINQGWTIKLDKFPRGGVITLPKGFNVVINSFSYIDADEVEQPLVQDVDYTVTTLGYEARIKAIGSFPQANTDLQNVVTVVFTVGLGADDTEMPAWVQQALLFKIQQNYDSCEDVAKGYDSIVDRRKLYYDYIINDY